MKSLDIIKFIVVNRTYLVVGVIGIILILHACTRSRVFFPLRVSRKLPMVKLRTSSPAVHIIFCDPFICDIVTFIIFCSNCFSLVPHVSHSPIICWSTVRSSSFINTSCIGGLILHIHIPWVYAHTFACISCFQRCILRYTISSCVIWSRA